MLSGDKLISGENGPYNSRQQIVVWDIHHKTYRFLGGLFSGVDFYVLAAIPGDRLVSCGFGLEINFWDMKTESCLNKFWGPISFAHAVLPGDRLALGSIKGIIQIWDTRIGTPLSTLKEHSGNVLALAPLPDGRLASGAFDNLIKIWDTKSWKCLSTLSGHSGAIEALVTLPDGRLASGSNDHTIKIWDTRRGVCLSTLSGHSGAIQALAILPENRLASGSEDHTIKVWDTQPFRFLKKHEIIQVLIALMKNSSVKVLSLNEINLQGCEEALLALLEARTDFTALDLSRTHLDTATREKVVKVLSRNETIHQITVAPGEIGDDVKRQIDALLIPNLKKEKEHQREIDEESQQQRQKEAEKQRLLELEQQRLRDEAEKKRKADEEREKQREADRHRQLEAEKLQRREVGMWMKGFLLAKPTQTLSSTQSPETKTPSPRPKK